jgi:hypothetical protein
MTTVSDGLLATMSGNVLPFWSEAGDLGDAGAVADLLGFDQGEIATASRLPKSQVRLQGRISPALMAHLLKWAVLLELVARLGVGRYRSVEREHGTITQ